jgi:hypothetical protein
MHNFTTTIILFQYYFCDYNYGYTFGGTNTKRIFLDSNFHNFKFFKDRNYANRLYVPFNEFVLEDKFEDPCDLREDRETMCIN